jgi:hypothetical protein
MEVMSGRSAGGALPTRGGRIIALVVLFASCGDEAPTFGGVDYGPPQGAVIIGPPAVPVGETHRYQAGALDQFGDTFPAPSTFSTSSGFFTAAPDGTVRGVSVGPGFLRVEITASGRTVRDSIHVTAVPPGTIVREVNRQLILGNLSGEGAILGSGDTPAWSRSGDRIVYSLNGELRIRDSQGNVTSIPTPGLTRVTRPAFSPDGSWIYFHANDFTRVHRVRSDGTQLEVVYAEQSLSPSISPDGARLAFASGQGLHVMQLATRTTTLIASGLAWANPRWSPDGQWIAAMDQGEGLTLMRPDGTERYVFQNWRSGHEGHSWSPDGRWIIGIREGQARLHDVVTRQVYPINWPAWGTFPAWRP